MAALRPPEVAPGEGSHKPHVHVRTHTPESHRARHADVVDDRSVDGDRVGGLAIGQSTAGCVAVAEIFITLETELVCACGSATGEDRPCC